MDETTSILPIPLSSNQNDDDEDEEESNQKNYNFGKIKKNLSEKNSRKTIFDDSELLNIISNEKNGRKKTQINKNTKINTNMTVTINLNGNNQFNDDECDFPDTETKLNSLNKRNDKKGNYLFSLDNLKRNKILTKNDMDQNKINGASINNMNVIENKNNVNHVQNLFKKDVEEKNNNLIFNNHIMVSGVAEISELTGNFFFFNLY